MQLIERNTKVAGIAQDEDIEPIGGAKAYDFAPHFFEGGRHPPWIFIVDRHEERGAADLIEGRERRQLLAPHGDLPKPETGARARKRDPSESERKKRSKDDLQRSDVRSADHLIDFVSTEYG